MRNRLLVVPFVWHLIVAIKPASARIQTGIAIAVLQAERLILSQLLEAINETHAMLCSSRFRRPYNLPIPTTAVQQVSASYDAGRQFLQPKARFSSNYRE